MHVPKTFTASASFPASAPTSRFWAWFWTRIPSSPVFMSWRWTSVSPRRRILKISCHFPLTLSSKKTWQTHEKNCKKEEWKRGFCFCGFQCPPGDFSWLCSWHIFKSRSNHVNIFLTWFASDVSSVTIQYESGRFTYVEVLEFSNECFLRPS